MDNAFEQMIRDRAYDIWLAAGMEGDADNHWLDAERAILSESAMPVVAAARGVTAGATATSIKAKTAPRVASSKAKPAATTKTVKVSARKSAPVRSPKAAAGSVSALA